MSNFEEAKNWIDANCEAEGDVHSDFFCRLRNALMGVDYEEGCPALDFIVAACLEKWAKDEKSEEKPDPVDLSATIDLRKVFEAKGEMGSKMDDLVHTLAAANASSINVRGANAQIDFVIDQLGRKQAIKEFLRIVGLSQ